MKGINSNTIPNPEWLRRMANAEDSCTSLSVGGMAHDLGLLQTTTTEPPKVFGRLIEFARRQRGLSVEALAEAANVDLAEIVAIETEKDVIPEPRTVYQLAQVLHLPAPTLTELAGLTQPRKTLSDAALRFAARSEPTTELSDVEKEAFEEFVKVLVENSDRG